MAGPKKERRAGVLAGHRKVGKRFIPPMADFALSEAKWVDELMPELLWIHLAHRSQGYAAGAELALRLARAALEVTPDADRRWFALLVALRNSARMSGRQSRRCS
jgi:hypothetical protein